MAFTEVEVPWMPAGWKVMGASIIVLGRYGPRVGALMLAHGPYRLVSTQCGKTNAKVYAIMATADLTISVNMSLLVLAPIIVEAPKGVCFGLLTPRLLKMPILFWGMRFLLKAP